MILWTIQHENAYKQMMQTGTLRANEKHLFYDKDFRLPYDYMATKMRCQISEAPDGVTYPIWLWYQWEGKRKRPDMRTHGKWTTKGTPIVLLTINIPDELILLSDFDMWHCVLNDCFLPLWEKDDKEIYSEQEKIKSWDNVFRWNQETDIWTSPKTTQATVWEVKKEWVIKTENFISR